MPKPTSTVSRIIAIAKLMVLVGIVVWLVRTFPKKDWDTLMTQDKNWLLLGQAFLVILAAHLISYWRWQMMVKALGVPFGLAKAIQLGFLGSLLNIVSVGAVGGDVFKAIEAARNAESKRTEVVASVLVDRAIGLLGLVLVAGTSLSLAPALSSRLTWIWWGAMVIGVVGVVGLFTIVYASHLVPIDWLLRLPLIGNVSHRVMGACMIFRGRPRLVLEMLASSVLVHTCLTLACVLISHALYAHCPSIAQHFMTIPPAMAAATLPLTPGGVGVLESAITLLFKEWPDVPEGYSGLIMASLFRVLQTCVAMIGAVYYFLGVGNSKTKSNALKERFEQNRISNNEISK
jgi:glycosyltransferase 2 family protein